MRHDHSSRESIPSVWPRIRACSTLHDTLSLFGRAFALAPILCDDPLLFAARLRCHNPLRQYAAVWPRVHAATILCDDLSLSGFPELFISCSCAAGIPGDAIPSLFGPRTVSRFCHYCAIGRSSSSRRRAFIPASSLPALHVTSVALSGAHCYIFAPSCASVKPCASLLRRCAQASSLRR